MNGLIFLIVIYFLKWIINDISKSEVSKVDQLINTITENKSIKYKSNDVELKTTLKRFYFEVLNMENGKVYDREMIIEQVLKQHSYYNEDVKIGYKARYNTKNINLAGDYIIDYYDYITNLN